MYSKHIHSNCQPRTFTSRSQAAILLFNDRYQMASSFAKKCLLTDTFNIRMGSENPTIFCTNISPHIQSKEVPSKCSFSRRCQTSDICDSGKECIKVHEFVLNSPPDYSFTPFFYVFVHVLCQRPSMFLFYFLFLFHFLLPSSPHLDTAAFYSSRSPFHPNPQPVILSVSCFLHFSVGLIFLYLKHLEGGF